MSYEFINDETLQEKTARPWTEKYRPEYLTQLVSHDDVVRILQKCIRNNNFPHLILQGPPGTGKTTSILACARQMYGTSMNIMVLELNGSDDRGIDAVREQINSFAQCGDITSNIFNINNRMQKLVILDEADSMTSDAQFALRTVIEANTRNTRFCLICNYSEKISPELKSRCMQFRFYPIPFDDHLEHVNNICNYENINIDEDAKEHIVKIASGDMRRSINVLQSLSMVHKNKHITLNMMYENICMPLPKDINNIISNIFSLRLTESFKFAEHLMNKKSLSVNDIITTLYKHIINNKKYDVEKTARVLIDLATIEQNLTINTNNSIQLCGAIASIKS